MDWVWVLLGGLIFLFGLMIFFGGQRKENLDTVVSHKNGLPLTPRHARQIVRPTQSNLPQDTSQLVSMAHAPPINQKAEESAHEVQDQEPPVTPIDTTSTISTSLVIDDAPLSASRMDTQKADSDKVANPTKADTNAKHWQQKPLHAYFEEKVPTGVRNHDALYDYKKAVTLMLTPKSLVLEGTMVLDLVRQYALRFGDLNMFHRYENPKGEGMLWFSVLGMTKDGLVPFDLAALPQMQYRGLAFFVALPNPQALRGFDSMVQVAQSIAQSVDADIRTEDGYLLNEYELKKMRHMVASY